MILLYFGFCTYCIFKVFKILVEENKAYNEELTRGETQLERLRRESDEWIKERELERYADSWWRRRELNPRK